MHNSTVFLQCPLRNEYSSSPLQLPSDMSTVVQVIGRNAYDELGNEIDSTSQLTISKIIKYSLNITEITSGDDFAIYSDGNQNFWAAGYNESHQYPILIDQSSSAKTVFHPIRVFQTSKY